MPTHPDDAFRALCLRVADETDSRKIELLKQRLRLLLLTEAAAGRKDEEKAERCALPQREQRPATGGGTSQDMTARSTGG